MNAVLLYNQPLLAADHPDAASEAGVLESVEAIGASLVRRGHAVGRVGLGEPAELQLVLAAIGNADVVFNLFEGFGGVGRGEAEVAGLCELLGFKLTGSPAGALALARDKARTKWLLAGAGVPTAEFQLIGPAEPIDRPALGKLLELGPAIVKPAHEDASLGIGAESIVRDLAALDRQVDLVRGRYGSVLVERFIVGREFNVSVLALPEPRVLPLAEIEFTGAEPRGWQIVTYAAKWDAGSEADRQTTPRCPANVDPETAERIRAIALRAFQLVGCRHYARVDLRLDEQNRPYVLEVNANPDIGPTAGFARALAAAGIDYDEFVERMAIVASV